MVLADHQISWSASCCSLPVLVTLGTKLDTAVAKVNHLGWSWVLNRSCMEWPVHFFMFAFQIFLFLPLEQLPVKPRRTVLDRCHGRIRLTCAVSLLLAGFPRDPQRWLPYFVRNYWFF